ncbi:TspO/MBR family protein, partial [Acinetobacter baumannii]
MNELSLALAIGSCVGVGALGSVATRRGLNGWYEALSKPAWNPPRWIFAPVWTLLYVMMGVAAWL